MSTIYTNEDTQVMEDWPTNNYGSQVHIDCLEESTHAIRVLVGFDISTIDVATVTAATLNIYCSFENNKTINVHRITSAWTEGSVTWNTKPSVTVTNTTSFACTTTGWKSVNILAMLQDESGSKFSVRLTDSATTTGSTKFHSKEYDSGSAKAYLSITGGAITGDKYVDISTGSDSDDGNTWANAYLTVKKGIDNISTGYIIHIAEGDYSAQAAIDLNKNLEILCEDYGGGNASPPLTVILPITT